MNTIERCGAVYEALKAKQIPVVLEVDITHNDTIPKVLLPSYVFEGAFPGVERYRTFR